MLLSKAKYIASLEVVQLRVNIQNIHTILACDKTVT